MDKIKIIYDITGTNTRIIDLETGKEIPLNNLCSISINMEFGNNVAILNYRYVNPEIELDTQVTKPISPKSS